jgi:hypothetical protein
LEIKIRKDSRYNIQIDWKPEEGKQNKELLSNSIISPRLASLLLSSPLFFLFPCLPSIILADVDNVKAYC